MRLWRRWYGNPLVDEVRARIREREWGQAVRGVLVLLRYHSLGLALPNERRMERYIRARERRVKKLRSRLAEERQVVERLRKRKRPTGTCWRRSPSCTVWRWRSCTRKSSTAVDRVTTSLSRSGR